jgi:phosphoribosylamine---glycine ligase
LEFLETFHRPLLAELARRGTPFRGALYAGLILTADGPVLLECNARFGDPETQAILPRLATPLGPWLLAAATGRLSEAIAEAGLGEPRLPTRAEATVAIVLAAAGYPEVPQRGDTITGLDEAIAAGGLVFHAGTERSGDGRYRTAGGRVLAVVGRGDDVASARVNADAAVARIAFDGAQRRHDIAAPAPRLVGAGGAR